MCVAIRRMGQLPYSVAVSHPRFGRVRMQSYTPPPPQAQPPGYAAPAGYPAAGQPRYGGFWIRFVARFLDGLVLGIPFGILLTIVTLATAGTLGTTSQDGQISPAAGSAIAGGYVLLYGLLAVASIAYFVFFWTTGATLGMRVLGLRVVDAQTGQNIGIGKGIVRYIGLIVSGLPCYLGYLWAAWDDRKQGWHDKMAGTVVLRS